MSWPEQLRHRRERLADMDRARHDDADRRHLHCEEHLAIRRLGHAAFADAQPLGEQVGQRIATRKSALLHKSLCAGRGFGDERRPRAARRAPR